MARSIDAAVPRVDERTDCFPRSTSSGLYEPLRELFEQVQGILSAHRASDDRSHKHSHFLKGSLRGGARPRRDQDTSGADDPVGPGLGPGSYRQGGRRAGIGCRWPQNQRRPRFSGPAFIQRQNDGGGEIRTLGTPIRRTTVFETAAFNRSATPPGSTPSRLAIPAYRRDAKKALSISQHSPASSPPAT